VGYLFQIVVLKVKHSQLKKNKMKNSFKMGALALVIAVSFAACKSKSSTTSTDSVKTDSVKVDSVKKDTTVKVDSTKKDTTKKDTTKKK
jgi:hypothetical protein